MRNKILLNFSRQIRLSPKEQFVFFRLLMIPLSYLFYLLLVIRNAFYWLGILKTRQLPGKCISIGGLNVGGGGKTPLVDSLLSLMESEGLRSVVLSRGYKSGLANNQFAMFKNGEVFFSNSDLPPNLISADEARMLSAKHPNAVVVIGRNRYQAALNAIVQLGYQPEHWILDDGFQHFKIIKDVEIVVAKELARLVHTRLLPAGDLREPISSLARSDLLFIDARDLEVARSLASGQGLLEIENVFCGSFEMGEALNVKTRAQCPVGPVYCLSAIANNESFVSGVSRKGYSVFGAVGKLDHSLFVSKDLDPFIRKEIPIVTTEKDYFRQKEFFDRLERTVCIFSYRFIVNEDGLSRRTYLLNILR